MSKESYRRNNPEKVKDSDRKYREANRDRILERRRKDYYDNRDKRLATIREYNKANPDKISVARISRVYNVDKETAEELHRRSYDVCESCGDKWDPEVHTTKLHIDHDHETGLVRGILCSPCNTSLGLLKESKERLLALVSYLEEHK